MLKPLLRSTIRKVPYLAQVYLERDRLRAEREQLLRDQDRLQAEGDQARGERDRLAAEAARMQADIARLQDGHQALDRELARYRTAHTFPPGHFFSPLPDLEEVRRRESAIFGKPVRCPPDVDMNEAGQLELFDTLTPYFREFPFPADLAPPLRYHYVNGYYTYGDAVLLYALIRHFRPRRLIEVGSGYSSCVILDTNELYCGNAVECTFIEPHPERLLGTVRPDERDRIRLVRSPVQDVPVERFRELEANDILLIDSSHVSKAGSDVNYLFFEVLPALRPGVLVHVHDVFYPIEYPREWILDEGRAWNEMYLLRAFLQYNSAFRVRLFNSFLYQFHKDRIEAAIPVALRYHGGCLWMQKQH